VCGPAAGIPQFLAASCCHADRFCCSTKVASGLLFSGAGRATRQRRDCEWNHRVERAAAAVPRKFEVLPKSKRHSAGPVQVPIAHGFQDQAHNNDALVRIWTYYADAPYGSTRCRSERVCALMVARRKSRKPHPFAKSAWQAPLARDVILVQTCVHSRLN
jgi:hypothetical protein